MLPAPGGGHTSARRTSPHHQSTRGVPPQSRLRCAGRQSSPCRRRSLGLARQIDPSQTAGSPTRSDDLSIDPGPGDRGGQSSAVTNRAPSPFGGTIRRNSGHTPFFLTTPTQSRPGSRRLKRGGCANGPLVALATTHARARSREMTRPIGAMTRVSCGTGCRLRGSHASERMVSVPVFLSDDAPVGVGTRPATSDPALGRQTASPPARMTVGRCSRPISNAPHPGRGRRPAPPVCEWCLGSATTSEETSRCRRRENSDPGQPTVRCRKRGRILDPAARGTGGGVVGSLHAAGPGSAASHSATAGRAAATVQQHRQNQTRQQECKCFHVLESLVGQIHLTRNRLCS